MYPFVARYLLNYPVQWFRGEHISRYLRELEQTQWLSSDELSHQQFEKALKIVHHAYYHVPFYRNKYQAVGLHPADIKSWDDYAKIPCLSKDEIKNNLLQLRAEAYNGPIDRKYTGGSTGEVAILLKDRIATAYSRASMWRGYGWWGLKLGDKQGRFWGIPFNEVTRRKYQFIDLLMNRIRLSAYNFTNEDMGVYYYRLATFKPKFFYGYVSMIEAFSHFVQDQGLDPLAIGVKVIVTTSEVLYPHQRIFIEEIFKCPVVNEYGCGELGPIAYDCPHGSMHLSSENVYLELLDTSLNPVPVGEVGEIVSTDLHGLAMPLIRYRQSDLGQLSKAKCDCGRGLPILGNIVGRVLDFIQTPDGRRFHGMRLIYLLEEMVDLGYGVRQFQVVQDRIDHIEVRIVKDQGYRNEALPWLRQRLLKLLGDAMNIDFTHVMEIPREPSGKMRVVISALPKSEAGLKGKSSSI